MYFCSINIAIFSSAGVIENDNKYIRTLFMNEMSLCLRWAGGTNEFAGSVGGACDLDVPPTSFLFDGKIGEFVISHK